MSTWPERCNTWSMSSRVWIVSPTCSRSRIKGAGKSGAAFTRRLHQLARIDPGVISVWLCSWIGKCALNDVIARSVSPIGFNRVEYPVWPGLPAHAPTPRLNTSPAPTAWVSSPIKSRALMGQIKPCHTTPSPTSHRSCAPPVAPRIPAWPLRVALTASPSPLQTRRGKYPYDHIRIGGIMVLRSWLQAMCKWRQSRSDNGY